MQLPNPLEINPNTLCQLHRYGLESVAYQFATMIDHLAVSQLMMNWEP